jgi:hypothetical protein
MALLLALLIAPASADVLVYGGTPAGIAAATAAAAGGKTVRLVEPYRWVGGMVTNGLSHTDFRTFEGLTGFYRRFTRRVEAYYVRQYGPHSPQVRDCLRGTHGEPKVNRAVFEAMLADHPGVTVAVGHRLTAVATAGRRVTGATFAGPGGLLHVSAGVVIDASYEGDLAAAAGVPGRVGREGRAEYGEPLAPDAPDGQVQGYNFRLTFTDDPANMAPVVAPPGYDPADFRDVPPLLASGKLARVFGEKGAAFKLQLPLPNRKRDVNDVSHSVVRLSRPDLAVRWPTGRPADRDEVFARQVRHQMGLLHFLRTDPGVPPAVRAEAAGWGPCRDEFADTGHLPDQLYVREARRIVGRYTFTERDTDRPAGDARTRHHPDAVAYGEYGLNCHGTGHAGPTFGGTHTGEFYKHVAPYPVPFGVMLPHGLDNLLVPVAASASHVGFCGLRLEPGWAALGEAAGTAAGLAVGGDAAGVPPADIRRRLHAAGAATTYVSDVPPDAPDFAAVQARAAAGGLHGRFPPPAGGPRGRQLVGQYYAPFPGHQARP